MNIPTGLTLAWADAAHLDEAVTNLLENAARYSGDAGRVRVTAHAIRGCRVRLTVEDDGPGVPPEALPHLFEKFYRVRREDGGRRGMGIGMSIVKGLVEAMGGRWMARQSELGDILPSTSMSTGPAFPLRMFQMGTAGPRGRPRRRRVDHPPPSPSRAGRDQQHRGVRGRAASRG